MKYINKVLFVCLLTVITLIVLKSNSSLKTPFYKYIYEENISFADINKWYKKYFGNQIPFIKEKQKMVMNEKITYKNLEKYQDGVKLEVTNNYPVSALKEGMVVFVGEKEGYGKTVIISGTDGIDIWYGNINSNVKIYDYINQYSLIGESVDNKLYIVIKKGDQILKYEDYI